MPGGPAADVLVLASGGCDSATLVASFARRGRAVQPMYVRFGLSWEDAELEGLRRFLRAARLPRVRPLAVLRLPVRETYGRHWSVTGRGVPDARSDDSRMYLPGRNLLLLSVAATYAASRRIPEVAVGTLRANPFADASRRFRKSFGAVASLALGRRVRVTAPFAGSSKADVLRRGRDLPLHLTFSCVAPVRGLHCGRCNKCAERRRHFAAAGLPDRTRYASPP